MHISWLGNSAIRLQCKPDSDDVIVVIDPYKPDTGVFPRSLSPQIALYTRGTDGSIILSGEPFILETPGECETKGILMTAVQGHSDHHIMVRIDAEQLRIGHLGMTDKPLTDAQLEVLSDVDILFVPVGGAGCYNADGATKAITAIEPRIVIPMCYQSDTDPKAGSVDSFLKEMGAANGTPEKKFIIKKKDLPVEETRVVVIAKES